MQRGILILKLSLGLFACTTLFTFTVSAGQMEREAALFVRNALDRTSPYSYWKDNDTESPTVSFYVDHKDWNDGTQIMRQTGTKLLSCVASLLSAFFMDRAKPISTVPTSSQRYRILVNPLPPGGGTELAAEGLAQSKVCPKGHEQELILHLLFSKANPHTF